MPPAIVDSHLTQVTTPMKNSKHHQEDPAKKTKASPVNQQAASTLGRSATEDLMSTATVVLHPRRPPYFTGGEIEDVHLWMSIVSRWLEIVQGELSVQMTFVVSLLRGVAYEWYTHYEMRTGCPGDWTTLHLSMLECFGLSIHANKA